MKPVHIIEVYGSLVVVLAALTVTLFTVASQCMVTASTVLNVIQK